MPTCSHREKTFRCKELNWQDVRRIHQAYFKEKSLLAQNKFRKIDVIEKPDIYMDIMKKHATVIRLGGENCPVRDWKTYADGQIKEPGNWHFKFQKAKKIIITETKNKNACLVQGEPFYNFESGEPKSVNKRGESFKNNTLPTLIPKGVAMKSKKAEDVKTLLKKHYGDQWEDSENLIFFSDIFKEQERLGAEDDTNDADTLFELLDEQDTEIVR